MRIYPPNRYTVIDESIISNMYEALTACDNAFVAWQVGQIPGRPEDILALIQKVRAALAKADGKEAQ